MHDCTGAQVLVAIALGALYTGNSGTYYAALETVPAALAGVLVYIYPVIVAILSCGSGRASPAVGRGSPWGSPSSASYWRSAAST